jgi:hypothetical protein
MGNAAFCVKAIKNLQFWIKNLKREILMLAGCFVSSRVFHNDNFPSVITIKQHAVFLIFKLQQQKTMDLSLRGIYGDIFSPSLRAIENVVAIHNLVIACHKAMEISILRHCEER